MPTQAFGKDEWVEMFREIGLDDNTMRHWHVRFEARHPEAHQSFLEWLEVTEADAQRIREASRTGGVAMHSTCTNAFGCGAFRLV